MAAVDNAPWYGTVDSGSTLGVDVRDLITVKQSSSSAWSLVFKPQLGCNPRRTPCFAAGAWMNEFVAVTGASKRQMLSCECLRDGVLLLQRVLFAPDIYIVPRRDGRIVISNDEEVGLHPIPVGIQAFTRTERSWLIQ